MSKEPFNPNAMRRSLPFHVFEKFADYEKRALPLLNAIGLQIEPYSTSGAVRITTNYERDVWLFPSIETADVFIRACCETIMACGFASVMSYQDEIDYASIRKEGYR